jgi:hypothetical protein
VVPLPAALEAPVLVAERGGLVLVIVAVAIEFTIVVAMLASVLLLMLLLVSGHDGSGHADGRNS